MRIVNMQVLSGNLPAVYFREELCYDSQTENAKIRKGGKLSFIVGLPFLACSNTW